MRGTHTNNAIVEFSTLVPRLHLLVLKLTKKFFVHSLNTSKNLVRSGKDG